MKQKGVQNFLVPERKGVLKFSCVKGWVVGMECREEIPYPDKLVLPLSRAVNRGFWKPGILETSLSVKNKGCEYLGGNNGYEKNLGENKGVNFFRC